MKIDFQNMIDNEFLNLVASYRRHIHKYPELSFKEFETSKYIRTILDNFGIENKQIATTGVLAIIGKKVGKCVALRADIDALPVTEETELEYASANVGIMHACGHDMHTSMLLGAAILLKRFETELNGTVKLLFQPGEEMLPGGATIMIQEGALDEPKVDAIFAQHIYPDAKTGEVLFCNGPALASTNEIYITINGKGSHAAQPHSGNDPILAASQLILHFQTLINKKRNPLEPGVLSITSIQGGNTTNIFPESVKLMGTLRTYNLSWRQEMIELITKSTNEIAQIYGCTADINILNGYPPLVNDNEITEFARANSVILIGERNVKSYQPKLWAEDFAYYLQKVPGTFWLLGVQPHDKDYLPPLHNSKLNPDENAIKTGITMLVGTAVNYLDNYA